MPERIGDLASLLSGIAGLGLLAVALWQLPFISRQLREAETKREDDRRLHKERLTVEVCAAWVTDPTLLDLKRSVRTFRHRIDSDDLPVVDSLEFQQGLRDVKNLINYLDIIAIGIESGVYDEDLVYTYMRWVFIDSRNRFLESDPWRAHVSAREIAAFAEISDRFAQRQRRGDAGSPYSTT